jgi:hypothetical protein
LIKIKDEKVLGRVISSTPAANLRLLFFARAAANRLPLTAFPLPYTLQNRVNMPTPHTTAPPVAQHSSTAFTKSHKTKST